MCDKMLFTVSFLVLPHPASNSGCSPTWVDASQHASHGGFGPGKVGGAGSQHTCRQAKPPPGAVTLLPLMLL